MLFFLILFVAPGTRSYFTAEEALHKIFPEATANRVIWSQWQQVPEPLIKVLSDDPNLRDARLQGELIVYEVSGQAGIIGWAVMTEELGKHQPMTMMVGIAPDLSVQSALLMTFRENRGSGVKHPKFQQQFDGKKTSDAVEVGIDIVHVSGSTISSRSMALAVRKSLRLITQLKNVAHP